MTAAERPNPVAAGFRRRRRLDITKRLAKRLGTDAAILGAFTLSCALSVAGIYQLLEWAFPWS